MKLYEMHVRVEPTCTKSGALSRARAIVEEREAKMAPRRSKYAEHGREDFFDMHPLCLGTFGEEFFYDDFALLGVAPAGPVGTRDADIAVNAWLNSSHGDAHTARRLAEVRTRREDENGCVDFGSLQGAKHSYACLLGVLHDRDRYWRIPSHELLRLLDLDVEGLTSKNNKLRVAFDTAAVPDWLTVFEVTKPGRPTMYEVVNSL